MTWYNQVRTRAAYELIAARSSSSANRFLYTEVADARAPLAKLTSLAVASSCLRPVYTEIFKSSNIALDDSDLCFVFMVSLTSRKFVFMLPE